jgi:hypothetical protein
VIILLGILIVLLCAVIQSATIAATRASVQKMFATSAVTMNQTRPHVFETIIFSAVLTILFFGIFLQAFVWACVFILTGEITDLQKAIYFSLVNFTSLGYGDIVLSEERAILGPMEASNGILMLGLSTSFLYSVAERLKAEREKHLRADR